MASQRESGRVIHDGLQARYRMTHKESERCSKHNDDVEIVVDGVSGQKKVENTEGRFKVSDLPILR